MNQSDYPQPTGYSGAPLLPTSTMATVSMIAGILGFVMLPVLGSIVALITGYLARQETRAVPPKASGDGMATAGIIMGWVGIGLMILGICCFIAYFVFIIGMVGVSNQ